MLPWLSWCETRVMLLQRPGCAAQPFAHPSIKLAAHLPDPLSAAREKAITLPVARWQSLSHPNQRWPG